MGFNREPSDMVCKEGTETVTEVCRIFYFQLNAYYILYLRVCKTSKTETNNLIKFNNIIIVKN